MDRTVDVQGIATRVRSLGSGPPVLVLHGWDASIESVGSILTGLSLNWTVHAPDLPGCGQSGPPPRPWGVEDYDAWVRALLAVLGLTRVAIVAHSHGGRTAIHLAAHHPELVERLVLVDAAGVRAPRTATWYRKVAMAKVAKHGLRRLGGPGERLADRLAGRSASADYAAADPVMRPTFVRLVNTDLRAIMPRVRASTLIIWGELDDAVPVSDGQEMERLIPDAGLVVFEGAGHFAYADQPARFRTIVEHFLADAGRAAA